MKRSQTTAGDAHLDSADALYAEEEFKERDQEERRASRGAAQSTSTARTGTRGASQEGPTSRRFSTNR